MAGWPCPAPAPVGAVRAGGAAIASAGPGRAAALPARPRTMEGHLARCKIVVVGDTQCGKTALLHVFAKDCYPEVCGGRRGAAGGAARLGSARLGSPPFSLPRATCPPFSRTTRPASRSTSSALSSTCGTPQVGSGRDAVGLDAASMGSAAGIKR